MKKVLLDSGLQYYKGNLHCHSTFSDGSMTVEEIKKAYVDQGYSVLAFTDHEHLIDNSHLTDDGFLAITACEVAIKEFAEQSTLKKLDMKVCHLNFYALDPHNIETPCYSHVYDHFKTNPMVHDRIQVPEKSYVRSYGADGINEMIRIATEQGFLVAYNHPQWSLESARDYLGYQGLWAIEIFNTRAWRGGCFEYDVIAYNDFLRDGHPMACIMGDDNHNIDDCFGGYVMINAEKLEYNEIMTALKEHRFYASTGPQIYRLFVEDGVARISVQAGCIVAFSTGTRRTEQKETPKEDGIYEVTFPYTKDDIYIRFDVIDEKGRRANTCAYFVEEC